MFVKKARTWALLLVFSLGLLLPALLVPSSVLGAVPLDPVAPPPSVAFPPSLAEFLHGNSHGFTWQSNLSQAFVRYQVTPGVWEYVKIATPPGAVFSLVGTSIVAHGAGAFAIGSGLEHMHVMGLGGQMLSALHAPAWSLPPGTDLSTVGIWHMRHPSQVPAVGGGGGSGIPLLVDVASFFTSGPAVGAMLLLLGLGLVATLLGAFDGLFRR